MKSSLNRTQAILLASAIVAVVLAACGAALAVRGGTGEKAGEKASSGAKVEEVSLAGTLTDEGVECQALRGEDGRLYTLTGDLGTFTTGDEVRVKGTLAEFSSCQQGTTVQVRKIEAEKVKART